MKNKNCPNCGAPVEIVNDKCPYCGTVYLDISAMPIHEPFILKLNVGTAEKPQIIIQRVRAQEVNMSCMPITNRATMCTDGAPFYTREYTASIERTYEITLVGCGDAKIVKHGDD